MKAGACGYHRISIAVFVPCTFRLAVSEAARLAGDSLGKTPSAGRMALLPGIGNAVIVSLRLTETVNWRVKDYQGAVTACKERP